MQTILVTGASSGVGRATALYLATRGFVVLAGVRKQQDADSLLEESGDRLCPVILDVTMPDHLTALSDEISARHDGRLAGLVNNAGVFIPGALELTHLEEIRSHLEINLLGPIAVIQSLLPHIRKGNGRIINIGSLNGRVAVPLQSGYASSKFGLEAVSDVLRLELDHWNIPVCQVDIGLYKTAIFSKAKQDMEKNLAAIPEDLRQGYDPLYQLIVESLSGGNEKGRDPQAVARVVFKALTAKRPGTRYRVGMDVKLMHALSWALPDRIMDLIILKGLPLLASNKFSRTT